MKPGSACVQQLEASPTQYIIYTANTQNAAINLPVS
jgi:hypothetical protein